MRMMTLQALSISHYQKLEREIQSHQPRAVIGPFACAVEGHGTGVI
jgi:hypothetical protein